MDDGAPTHTYQTHIEVSPEVDRQLCQYAKLMSKVVRSLFALCMAGKKILSLKSSFLIRFGITARQFNACRVQVDGKIKSIRRLNELRICELKERIKKVKETIERLVKRKRKVFRIKAYCKKIHLQRLQKKLAKLEQDQKTGKVRLCFGSRKLFRKQYNGEQSHDEWKKEWEEQRNQEFFTLGSKDETGGNQTRTAKITDDGSLILRLRLPDVLGKYIEIPDVRFVYGHEVILAALEENRLRADLAKQKNSTFKNHGQAISYRFVKDRKGWKVFASTTLPEPQWVSNKKKGTVGVDINVDHLAVVETDHYGNPINTESIPLSLYGKDQNQAKAIIGDACARAVEIAVKASKPLIVERLDFTKKKQNLKKQRPSSARLLSSFSYSQILQTLRSRAYRSGVELFDVNPAFTSLIGRFNYATRYGLSIHQAAALCIARRFQGFSEKLSRQSSVPDGKGRYIAFSVPVRNQEKHEWQYLKKVAQKLRAALAEHFRVTQCQSLDPPKMGLCDEKSSRIVGEIPTREPLATLLG